MAGFAVARSILFGVGLTAVYEQAGWTQTASEPLLPDLLVSETRAAESATVIPLLLDSGSCALEEGCVTGTGTRRLLIFDAQIINLGAADLVLGSPADLDGYRHDACHQHYHLGSVMTYELAKPDGTTVAVSRKQGFCLEDSEPVTSGAPGKYDCEFQGISVGWSDVYSRTLDCQWIDVTDVAPGDYLLRLTVNPEGKLRESNLQNNRVEVPITIGEGES